MAFRQEEAEVNNFKQVQHGKAEMRPYFLVWSPLECPDVHSNGHNLRNTVRFLKCALPSGAKDQIEPNGANMANRAL